MTLGIHASNAFSPATVIANRLATLYRGIAATTMNSLPISNPRLGVQAVGFRLHEGHAVGVVVTPWFMNIVIAAVETGPPLPPARPGDARAVRLPAGTVEVIVGELAGFGRLDSASLFSPMFAFDDPAVAEATAAAVMAALFEPAPDEAPVARNRRAVLFGWGVAPP